MHKRHQDFMQHDDVIFKHQASVPIHICNYQESILCDIIPMEIGHIILGQP